MPGKLGELLLTIEGDCLVRYLGTDRDVQVPDQIQRFGPHSFAEAGVRSLSFTRNSQLRRIDSQAFFRCASLRLLEIPPSVDSIDGSAFACCRILQLFIAKANRHFRFSGQCLMDFPRTSLVRYLGSDSDLTIACNVEAISDGAFSYCDTIRSVAFESPSQLRRIGGRAFAKCANLKSISIPSSTESLGESSFLKCKALRTVRVESGSQLRLIEPGAFWGCSALESIYIPSSVMGNKGVDFSGAPEAAIVWTQ
jgi:hypothetical protein